LREASLNQVNLTSANMTGAIFWNAQMTGVNLTRADLTRANLAGATLAVTSIEGAEFTDAILPKSAQQELYERATGSTRWSQRPTRETLEASQFVDQVSF
ncbi:MAG TPA: pentapeptide repeat-containing protein, partial [Candidatus Obscuribacterales bacterium]